jgi:hypothetical protein
MRVGGLNSRPRYSLSYEKHLTSLIHHGPIKTENNVARGRNRDTGCLRLPPNRPTDCPDQYVNDRDHHHEFSGQI